MSFFFAGIIYLIIGIGAFITFLNSRKIWQKTIAGITTTLMLMTVTFLSFNYIQITNSEQTNLVNALLAYYQIGTYAFWASLFVGILIIVIIAINAMRDYKKQKRDNEWEEWGNTK